MNEKTVIEFPTFYVGSSSDTSVLSRAIMTIEDDNSRKDIIELPVRIVDHSSNLKRHLIRTESGLKNKRVCADEINHYEDEHDLSEGEDTDNSNDESSDSNSNLEIPSMIIDHDFLKVLKEVESSDIETLTKLIAQEEET